MSDILDPTPDYEKEKLEIERQKLVLESRKVEIELSKSKWTGISVAASLFAALGTIVYGLYSTNHQAQTAFEVELAKVIAGSDSPGEALGRAQFFMKLFPNRLPKTFIGEVEVAGGASKLAVQTKVKLFEALSEKLDEDRAFSLYRKLFPWSDYGSELTLPDKSAPGTNDGATKETGEPRKNATPTPESAPVIAR